MACSACEKRRQGRIVPVNPATKPKSNQQGNANSATAQGNALRNQLRYTGR